jgi:hypothetical protein
MKNGTVSVFGDTIERTAKERAHLIELLQDSQKEYLSYVENVSEAQWNWKPGHDRWSIGENGTLCISLRQTNRNFNGKDTRIREQDSEFSFLR